MKRPMIGVIIGNRSFFPDQLVTQARSDIVKLFRKLGIEAVMLSEHDSQLGMVETYADAKKCAQLFRGKQDLVDGVLVVLPNFSDERGVAETLRIAGLNVPVLVQAYPDDLNRLDVAHRRDAFCGKISVCNNLKQYGIPFSLTSKHVVHLMDESFQADLAKFLAVCRVVKGLRSVRLGAVGARPAAFNTVRYSERILEAYGISVTTVDFSELMSRANRIGRNTVLVKDKLKEIRAYAETSDVPADRLIRMAKLGVVLSEWIVANDLDASAIQCWTSIQENFGINVCTIMSMMSEAMMPSACEVDVTGVLMMYAMQLASNRPSAIADWNNNYGDDENRCVLFHCGNWAKCFLPDARISTAPIIGTTVGIENTYGALEGRTRAGPFTFGRLTTDDRQGEIRAYIGKGTLTNNELNTFGARAVAHVPKLRKLMRFICENGFEHHVVINRANCANILFEAFQTYLGWNTYYHECPEE